MCTVPMRYITQRKPSAQTGRGEGAVLLYHLKDSLLLCKR